MKERTLHQELHHEIFGSILDREEMAPYLLLKAESYNSAIKQATQMMGNRGFDTIRGIELEDCEKNRALDYIKKAYRYSFRYLFPYIKKHLRELGTLRSDLAGLYDSCLNAIDTIETVLNDRHFKALVHEDPRHIFLLASSKKFPHVFDGYKGRSMNISPEWQHMACSLLKIAHLIKSIEEDNQDVNDYAQLGLHLEMQGQGLDNLYNYDWENPGHLPDTVPAQRAFVKVATFFHKLKESVKFNDSKNGLEFKSGDGVDVDIVNIKARLKSPESMFTKLGKNVEGEAHTIRDMLAITFILRNIHDTLKLFHALQKRGVILQENTISPSITQTLFKSPEEMNEAVRNLMISLSQSEGEVYAPDADTLTRNTEAFFMALSINTQNNPHSALEHKKFQCKINYSVPIQRLTSNGEIIIPGTPGYKRRKEIDKKTEQHTLDLELRISDIESWQKSEQKGDAHHDAYKFRQMSAVMNRLFKGLFNLPHDSHTLLRQDQQKLFL